MLPLSLDQKITVWEVLGEDGMGGYSYSLPEVVDAKYALINESFRDASGDTVMSKAVVYTMHPIEPNNHMVFFGESSDSFPPSDAEEIRAIKQNPSMTGLLRKGWV